MERITLRALANAIPAPDSKMSIRFRVDEQFQAPLDQAKALFDAGAAIPINPDDIDKLKGSANVKKT